MPTITINEERTQDPVPKKKNRLDAQDGLSLLGFILLETGIAKINVPSALICAGVICLLPFITSAIASVKRALRRSE